MNAEINIPRPRLLNNSGGTERWITPTRVSINLAIEPLSDATMALPKGESLPARGYVELFTCMGSAGIFRVRSPQDAYGMLTTTAELESAVAEVGDYLVKLKKDEMVAANTAITTIWGYYSGSKWQLGDISAIGSGQVALEVNYDRVLDALLAILEQKPECMLSFNYSTSPWTLSIVARGTTVTAEGRLARNVNYARVSYDDTELCTRVYYERQSTTDSTDGLDLSGIPTFNAGDRYNKDSYVVYAYDSKLYLLPNGHEKDVTWENTTKTLKNDIPTSVWEYMDADTIGTYGRVERTISTGKSYTQDEALQAASEYLRKHKQPKVSVEISAAELSHITGESIDSFEIGKLFRLALSDYNVTVERNITNLYFEDVYEAPDRITVTLADEEDTALTFLHDVDSKGGSGGGGGGGKKKDDIFKEFQTFFKMDDRNIDLYAVQYKSVDEILRQAGLHIDANGVLIYAEDNEKMVGSKFTVQANKISMVVGTNQDGNFIKAAEIATAINDQDEGIVYINADRVNISATHTAHTLAGELEYDSQGRLIIKNAGGLYVRKTQAGVTSLFGVWDKGNLTGGIMVQTINGTTETTIRADKINIQGIVNALVGYDVTAESLSAHQITSDGECTFDTIVVDSLQINGYTSVLVDATVSQDGTTLTLEFDDGSTLDFEKGDTEAAYNDGWNDCIDAATELTRYTRSAGSYGGNRVHYIFNSDDELINVGNGWYKTTQANAYQLPSRKL